FSGDVVADNKPNRSPDRQDWLGQPGIPDIGQDLDNLGPDFKRVRAARGLSDGDAIALSKAHDGALPGNPPTFSRESQTSAGGGHAYAASDYASPRQGSNYFVFQPLSATSSAAYNLQPSNTTAPPDNAPPPMPCAGGALSGSGLDVRTVEGRNDNLQV